MFSLMSADFGEECKIKITNATLYVGQSKLNKSVLLARSKAVQLTIAKLQNDCGCDRCIEKIIWTMFFSDRC